MRLRFLLLFFVSIGANAQEPIFQAMSQSELYSVNRKADNNGFSFEFYQNGGSIISKNKILDPDSVSLVFAVNKPSNIMRLQFEWSTDKTTWNAGPSIEARALSVSKGKLEKIEGKYSLNVPPQSIYVRLTTKDMQEGDSLLVYEFTIYGMGKDRKNFFTLKNTDELETQKLIELRFEKKDTQEYNSAIRKYQKKYFETLSVARLLLNNNNKILDFTSVIKIINARNRVVNPLSYQSFNNMVTELRADADTIDKILIDQMKAATEVKIEKKPTMFSNLLGAGYKIVNFFTGGKLETVFSSIKQIFARTYAQGTILMNHIQGSAEKENNGSPVLSVMKDKKTVVISSSVIQEAQRKSGIQIQKLIFLEKLFTILESESSSLNSSIQLIDIADGEVGRFNKEIQEYLNSILFPISLKISDEDLSKLSMNDPKYVGYLTDSLNNYFRSMVLTKKDAGAQRTQQMLQGISENFENYSTLENKYVENINSIHIILKGIASYFELDNNPFKAVKNIKEFSGYYAEWEKQAHAIRKDATTLPQNIINNYGISVQNAIELIRKGKD